MIGDLLIELSSIFLPKYIDSYDSLKYNNYIQILNITNITNKWKC